MIQEHPTDPNYRWKVLGIVMVGTLMSALDSSIVNVSLPKIMADFGASIDDIEWVITGYMLSFATLMPLTAWMRDKIGPKVLYTGALIVFTLGSLLCGVAWNLPSLIFARVIQAFGGGALTPIGMAMISDVFEPRERAKALGYWGIGAICGPAFGPTLGGYLTNQVSWRAIFLVNLPIGIIGTLWAMKTLRKDPPSQHRNKTFDLAGFLFLSVFLISFLLGLSKGDKEGWTSVYIVTCFLLSIVGLVGFLTVEPLVKHPVMDLTLFKHKVFTAAVIVTAGRSVALFGGTFLLPLFLQQLIGLDEIQSGLILLPGALFIGLVMPFSARISEIFGPRAVTFVGLLGVGISMFMYRDLNVNTSIFHGVIVPTLIRGFGIGLLIAPVVAAAMNAVPAASTAAASSMLNLIQQVSGSIGIGILGTALSTRTKFHMGVMGTAVQKTSPTVIETSKNIFYQAHQLGYSHADSAKVVQGLLVQHVSKTASVAAFEDAFIIGGVAVVLGLLASLMMPKKAGHVDAEHLVME